MWRSWLDVWRGTEILSGIFEHMCDRPRSLATNTSISSFLSCVVTTMADVLRWKLLPPDLVELQIGQIDLVLAMYPEEILFEDDAQRMLEILRSGDADVSQAALRVTPNVSMILDIPIEEKLPHPQTLRLDLGVPFVYDSTQPPLDPPEVKVRAQQPAWMSKIATSQLMSGLPEGEDLPGTIEHIREAAAQYLVNANRKEPESDITRQDHGPLVRVWFYFPSISTRSKRNDFITHAPRYHLTGFLYAGKPGLLCVEGGSQSIDEYMKFIKTESWGDIPAHHKKVSERHREQCEQRVFEDMTEITDTVGERRGQRANRGDMRAVEEWLVERGLGDAFTKVLM
jgi:hypothetical protein